MPRPRRPPTSAPTWPLARRRRHRARSACRQEPLRHRRRGHGEGGRVAASAARLVAAGVGGSGPQRGDAARAATVKAPATTAGRRARPAARSTPGLQGVFLSGHVVLQGFDEARSSLALGGRQTTRWVSCSRAACGGPGAGHAGASSGGTRRAETAADGAVELDPGLVTLGLQVQLGHLGRPGRAPGLFSCTELSRPWP